LYNFVRAAGFAAAAIGAAFSPALADPSRAFDLTASPPEAPYTAHLQAVPAIPVEQPAPEEPAITPAADVAAPIVRHAISPLLPDAAEPAREEKSPKLSLLALVDKYDEADASTAELECLAGAIYFESKGEPLAGQLAVAEVIINRTKSGRYPTTMCGVVKQRGQFSFVRAGRIPPIPKQSAPWRKAVAIAHIAVKDLADSPAEDALSFHATYVSPRWRMKRVATVGNHIFYR
jgi:hypothetical protein